MYSCRLALVDDQRVIWHTGLSAGRSNLFDLVAEKVKASASCVQSRRSMPPPNTLQRKGARSRRQGQGQGHEPLSRAPGGEATCRKVMDSIESMMARL